MQIHGYEIDEIGASRGNPRVETCHNDRRGEADHDGAKGRLLVWINENEDEFLTIVAAVFAVVVLALALIFAAVME